MLTVLVSGTLVNDSMSNEMNWYPSIKILLGIFLIFETASKESDNKDSFTVREFNKMIETCRHCNTECQLYL